MRGPGLRYRLLPVAKWRTSVHLCNGDLFSTFLNRCQIFDRYSEKLTKIRITNNSTSYSTSCVITFYPLILYLEHPDFAGCQKR